MRNLHRNKRLVGFTLIELMIVVAILGLVFGSLAMMSRASDRAYKTSSTRTQLEAQSTVALDRVLDELRLAVTQSVDASMPAGGWNDSIDFAHALGLDAAKIVQGPKRRIALELEAGEADDGVDNNGNGLIDERRLVLTENVGEADERQLVITRWVPELLNGEEENGLDDNGNGFVDEPGFVVERTGRTLTVHLTLARLDGEGRLLSRTVRSSTSMRN